MHQRRPQVPLLAALGEVVNPMGGDPVDRVANHVEKLRVGDGLVHALGHPDVLRVGRVVGRGLTPHRGARVEVRAVPVEAAREVALGDEEVELLRLRHRRLGVQAQVVVQAARAALLRADHDQVRERAQLGAATRRGNAGPPACMGVRRRGRRRGARPGLHPTQGSVQERRETGVTQGIAAIRTQAGGHPLPPPMPGHGLTQEPGAARRARGGREQELVGDVPIAIARRRRGRCARIVPSRRRTNAS